MDENDKAKDRQPLELLAECVQDMAIELLELRAQASAQEQLMLYDCSNRWSEQDLDVWERIVLGAIDQTSAGQPQFRAAFVHFIELIRGGIRANAAGRGVR